MDEGAPQWGIGRNQPLSFQLKLIANEHAFPSYNTVGLDKRVNYSLKRTLLILYDQHGT